MITFRIRKLFALQNILNFANIINDPYLFWAFDSQIYWTGTDHNNLTIYIIVPSIRINPRIISLHRDGFDFSDYGGLVRGGLRYSKLKS